MSENKNITEVDGNNTPTYKLFSLSGVVIASIFGSILAGGILMGQNFQRLGKPQDAKKTYWATALGTIVGFFVAMHLSKGGTALPFGVSLVVALALVMKQLQGAAIARHQEQKGLMESNWKALGLSLLVAFGIVVLIIFFVAILR